VADEVTVWIDPVGTQTTLAVDWGRAAVSGRFSPPVIMDEEGIPEQNGQRLRAVRFGPQQFVLPLWVTGATPEQLRTNMRALVSALNPKRGDGIVRVTSTLGDQREIVCRVIDGLQVQERLGDSSGPTVQFMPVVFKAHDPLWRDVSDTVSGPWTVGSSPGSFFPFFPLRLSSSEIFAQATVVNAGDDDAWPVWTINGPGDSPKFKNLTTGKTIDLGTYFIVAGEVVTIDTRPTGSMRKTVVSNINGNLYPRLTAASALWPLVVGSNQVSVEMGTSFAGSTSVQMAYRNRYLAV
jgi:hypothetical protein